MSVFSKHKEGGQEEVKELGNFVNISFHRNEILTGNSMFLDSV